MFYSLPRASPVLDYMHVTLQLRSVRMAPDFAWYMRLKVLAAFGVCPFTG